MQVLLCNYPLIDYFFNACSPKDETYELPPLPVDRATVRVNPAPAGSENVITSSNPAYGHFGISKQKNDTKKEEEMDNTYEPIPFDTARQ